MPPRPGCPEELDMSPTPEAQALMQGMHKKKLYVALRQPVDLSRLDSLLQAHLEWAVKCEQRGELVASGPFVGQDAAPGTLGGMSIFRASSEDEVWRILREDPFIQQGVFT